MAWACGRRSRALTRPRRAPNVRGLPSALASAALLIAAFPPYDQPWAAWGALVPWLRLIQRRGPRAAFWWSWAVGCAFFLGSLSWLTRVTVIGWAILSALLALYFGAFGALARSVLRQSRPAAALAVLPAGWVALEFLRSRLLSGFGWNLLAYSQTSWLPVIQIADVTGAWGVSYLVAFVNVALTVQRLPDRSRAQRPRAALALAAGLALATLAYGAVRVRGLLNTAPRTLRIAVLQGNIPQDEKWDDAHKGPIMDRYEVLARRAAATAPDLIVWPETSMPGFFWLDRPLTRRLRALAASLHATMLVGVPVSEGQGEQERLFNSAVLLSPEGRSLQRYDKLHLVPFGEFIPFDRQLPWVRRMLPPVGEFSAGRKPTVFHLPQEPDARFSALICFEDVFPHLARAFVRHGANVLLVMTNDAWFGPTAAAYQHAQASTFRAVELRRPVARAANTGWSGCIDAAGRWTASVQDHAGRELFVPGTVTCSLALPACFTVYARAGDWLPFCALAAVAAWLAGRLRRRRARRRTRANTV